jgi:hypothetical protein
MGISTTRSRNDETQKVQVWGSVDVGVIHQTSGGYARKMKWRPTEIVACFSRFRVDGGDWSSWEVESLHWSGMTVRADQAAGVPRSERLYLTDLLAATSAALHEVRRWVRSTTPDGELQKPFRPVPAG